MTLKDFTNSFFILYLYDTQMKDSNDNWKIFVLKLKWQIQR